MKKTLSIILSVIMLLTSSMILNADAYDETASTKTIKVAINADFEPFEYYDDNNQLAGFDIDIMNYIGYELGCNIEYVDVEYDEILNTVISGEADCAISMLTVTSEKREWVNFSYPYLAVTRDYGPATATEAYSIAVKLGESQLLEDINQVITDASHNGKISELLISNNISELAMDDPYYYVPTVYGKYRFVAIENPSNWAREEVIHAFEIGLAENEKDYDYIEPINREEFCEFIFRLILITQGSVTTEEVENTFTDTDNSNIIVLSQLGIINGKSETEFAPDYDLTREEAATIIVRMINKFMLMAVTEKYYDYADKNNISEWAEMSVQTISNLGFMTGVGDNKFAPKDTYTVEQSIITLSRIYDKYDATRETYQYVTPLGIISSKTDFNSHINFAIEAEARIILTKNIYDYEDTSYIIPGPVKVFTDGISSDYIAFDDFAKIFDGEWSFNGNMFEFTYDASKNIVLSEYAEKETSNNEWPNKTESVPVLIFSDLYSVIVNGEETRIFSKYGGKIVNAHIMMYNNELYIPVFFIAELLNYDFAKSDILWDY